MESTEIEIGSVHHIEGPGFDRQDVEDVDIVGLAVGNPHETRDISAQVDERVKFDRGLVASELSPGEQRQAEIDGRGIQRVGGMLELNAEAIGLVQPPRPSDQDLSEVRVDPPVAVFVGIGESAPSDDAAKAGVVEFLVKGAETEFRCLAGSRDRSVERRPCREIDRNKRSCESVDCPDSERRNG